MKIQLLALILTVINLVLLFFVLTQTETMAEYRVAPVLHAQAIELVDNQGQVRAQLNIESSGETVFRLWDAQGTLT